MGWEDIEEMPTVNLREELLALLDREQEYTLPPSPSGPCAPSAEEEDDAVRRNVCQWNYECVDYFLLDREAVYLSMHYFDRYLARQAQSIAARKRKGEGEGSSSSSKPSVLLSHLLALASLYVACKLHGVSTEPQAASSEGGQKKIRLQDFCQMSRGTYCPQMLEEMELSLLTNLQWKVHPPTPTDFLLRFVKILSLLLNSGDVNGQNQQHSPSPDVESMGKGWSVFEVARYQIELAVYSPELCHGLPSTTALAALLNAMDSKVVRTKRTVVSSQIRDSFLEHVKCLGGGFMKLDLEGEDMVKARTTLKALCSKTIVLPGQIVDDPPETDRTFAPIQAKSFEYELPEVSPLGASISPVSVAADF